MNPYYQDVVDLGSLCSGYGGLEQGIGMVIPNTHTAWVADYDPPTVKRPNPKQTAAAILAHRYPDAPNLGDITTVDWPTTTPVRIVCGGTPCQDVSAAGARAGMRAGTRSGIWSSMVEAINHHRPTLVVWENVEGALSAPADSNMVYCPICMGDPAECSLRALGRVVGDLSEIGYDAAWDVVAASDVGAPHRRNRVFVIAWPANRPDADPADVGHERGRPPRRRGTRPEDSGHPAAHAEDAGRESGERVRDAAEKPEAVSSAADASHPNGVGRESLLGGVRPGQPDATRGGRDAAADPEGHGRHEGGGRTSAAVRAT